MNAHNAVTLAIHYVTITSIISITRRQMQYTKDQHFNRVKIAATGAKIPQDLLIKGKYKTESAKRFNNHHCYPCPSRNCF
ncbi:MAG: hypothetical protein EOO07_06580 [Chitinophagaceae bacterium]|nr:MAG: hypothetical protein EOO07_06580 [Chitinophagaceae bacterium]